MDILQGSPGKSALWLALSVPSLLTGKKQWWDTKTSLGLVFVFSSPSPLQLLLLGRSPLGSAGQGSADARWRWNLWDLFPPLCPRYITIIVQLCLLLSWRRSGFYLQLHVGVSCTSSLSAVMHPYASHEYSPSSSGVKLSANSRAVNCLKMEHRHCQLFF